MSWRSSVYGRCVGRRRRWLEGWGIGWRWWRWRGRLGWCLGRWYLSRIGTLRGRLVHDAHGLERDGEGGCAEAAYSSFRCVDCMAVD